MVAAGVSSPNSLYCNPPDSAIIYPHLHVGLPTYSGHTLLIVALKFEGVDCMVNDAAPV